MIGMRYLTKLVGELNFLVKKTQPGQTLTPPKLLSKVSIDGKDLSYLRMGIRHEGVHPHIFIHGFTHKMQ